MAEIPYCEEGNKKKSKDFVKKFYKFTGDNFRLLITWKTRKILTVFPGSQKTFILHVKYVMIYMNVVKIIPVKWNKILKQERYEYTQSTNQNLPDIF